jgi:hypothetical protein
VETSDTPDPDAVHEIGRVRFGTARIVMSDKTPRANHSDWRHILFYVGLSLLICHELDAVARTEWRLLPGLSLLDDQAGYFWFVALHLPLFVLIFWATGHRRPVLRRRSQLAVDLFLVGHATAHFLLSGHEHYLFEGVLEWSSVYGGAAVGALHAVLLLRARRV